jgi:hypothetical protein
VEGLDFCWDVAFGSPGSAPELLGRTMADALFARRGDESGEAVPSVFRSEGDVASFFFGAALTLTDVEERFAEVPFDFFLATSCTSP